MWHQQFLGPLWIYRPDASNVRQRSERKMGSRTIPTAGILAGEIMARIKQALGLCVCIEIYGLDGTKTERERTSWQLIAICSGVDVFSTLSPFIWRERKRKKRDACQRSRFVLLSAIGKGNSEREREIGMLIWYATRAAFLLPALRTCENCRRQGNKSSQ